MNKAMKTGLLALFFVGLILSWSREATVTVSTHGVDYSGNGFNYFILNQEDPEKVEGGEHVEPYSAGGTVCCAELPRKWAPGTRVKIKTIVALSGEYPEEPLREIKTMHVVDVPPYKVGKPGELWVLYTPEGKIDVVSSDVQPDHPTWPGAIKGWPVPSRAYRLMQWETYKKIEEGNVKLYESMLLEIREDPARGAKEAWDFARSHDPKELQKFSGPTDPDYMAYLRSRYEEGLSRSKTSLKAIVDAKP